MARQAVAVLATLLTAHAAVAQFTQQGGKLVGAGAVGAGLQAASVAISADGNTAIVGAPDDNSSVGAAWVFTRSGGVWSQQGAKLVGTGAVGAARQGYSVAVSGDGNTAIIGGSNDNSSVGAAWVFIRTGGVWSQQGGKLVGTGAVGTSYQGNSVALSADRNTEMVGGFQDNSHAGAAWVFTRSGGVWTQQGGKLVGTGAVGSAYQGGTVALSSDGNTAIEGGFGDNGKVGAAWVFTRSGGAWTQQGAKLVGTGAVGAAQQGSTVAISADGNTALIGGWADNSQVGAVWVYTRSGGAWTQQGNKLVGTGAAGAAQQGAGLALSGDGNTAVWGGSMDSAGAGATWVFTRSGGVWSQLGGKLVGTGAVGAAEQGSAVVISSGGSTVIVGGYADNSEVGAAWIFVASTSSSTVWVPVVAHNPGQKQSQWRSDLGLLNGGTGQANVQLKFYGASVVTNTTYVPAKTQSILTDVVAQLGTSGQGALQVISDRPLMVTARTYNQVASTESCYPNGTQGQNYPVLTASDGLGAGQSAYLGGLTENASYRSNVGLVNVGSGTASVLVELYNGAGTKLTSYTVSLAAGQWAQETQPFKAKAGQTAMARGYAKVTVQSGSGVFAFASVMDNLTNDPTTVTMQK